MQRPVAPFPILGDRCLIADPLLHLAEFFERRAHAIAPGVVATIERQIERHELYPPPHFGDDAWRDRVRAAFEEFCKVKQRVGDEAPITEDWEWRHRALHLALLSACGSPTLLRFCEQV